jgi:malate synthase
MEGANQLTRRREEVRVTANDLLTVPEGPITEEGLRWNIDVGLQYLESWLRGSGCVPIYNLMEDAATAEISRAQVWQWLRHEAKINGHRITREWVREVIADQKEKLKGRRMEEAAEIYDRMMTSPEFAEFLTLVAYDYID